MTPETFVPYREASVRDYAREKVAAGAWPEADALARSEAEWSKLLPEGIDTPKNHFFSVVVEEEAEPVGAIWFAEVDHGSGPLAFVYDVLIHEPFRRRGYAFGAMRALEAEVAQAGLSRILLHVFGHNQAALALYEKVGYGTTDVMMAKTIEPNR